MNITDTKAILSLAKKDFLTKGQQQAKESTVRNMKSYGITPSGAYQFSRLSYFDSLSTLSLTRETRGTMRGTMQGVAINDIVGTMPSNILTSATTFSNLDYNLKVPFIDGNNAEFNSAGISTELTSGITTIELAPKRIVSYMELSRNFRDADNHVQTQILEQMNYAIIDTLISTIFSDSAETSDQPKGIFNGQPTTQVASIDDLLNMQYNVDKNKVQGIWLVSPKAQQYIYKNFANYLNVDGKLFGSPMYVDGRVQDGYIAYLDISKLVVCDWTFNDVTIDPCTANWKGVVKLYCETYADFGMIRPDLFLSVGTVG